MEPAALCHGHVPVPVLSLPAQVGSQLFWDGSCRSWLWLPLAVSPAGNSRAGGVSHFRSHWLPWERFHCVWSALGALLASTEGSGTRFVCFEGFPGDESVLNECGVDETRGLILVVSIANR